MTSEVVTAVPDMPTREIAQLLSRHGISALPVVDAFGAPIGMVSEGDLIGRIGIDRDMRRDWWLTLFSEAPMLSADSVLALAKLFGKLRVREKRACEIMSAPLITVGETADEQEIAGLLTAHHIKRVPVVRDGKLVGIVSRADLIRAMASKTTRQSINSSQRGLFGMIFDGLDRRFAESQEERPAIAPAAVEPQTATADAKLDASDFRNLVAGFEKEQALHHDEEHRVAVKQPQEMVKQLLDEHISDERWRGIMHEAREAAARGEKQYMLLRFPASLCSDQGRSINALNQSADWPETLRGEAAEFYQYWKRDLQPYGFRLGAWVLDFPGGIPGDIGLFLMWGG
jgi:CBS domain-containing protein